MKLYADSIPTPNLDGIGDLLAVVRGDGALRRLDFVGRRSREELVTRAERGGHELVWDPTPGARTRDQVRAFFAGERRTFDLELDLVGTPFQLRVWHALLEIPHGTTWTYGQLARHIGSPGASRAVGAANGANPISLVVPCHRVVGANGKLTGYGGGLPTKQALLEFERGQQSFVAGA